MTKFVRKSREERLLEIRTAALDIFLNKGYTATTMDDIVEAVDMSKGSVYRYYPCKQYILTDLLKEGVHLRNELISKYKIREKLSLEQIAYILTDLLFCEESNGAYAKLYVIFLYEKMFNVELDNIYKEIMSYGIDKTLNLNLLISEIGEEKLTILVAVLNTFFLGKFILKDQYDTLKDRQMVNDIILNMIS